MGRKGKESTQLNLVLPEASDIERLIDENRHLTAENGRLRTQVARLTSEIERLRNAINVHADASRQGLPEHPNESTIVYSSTPDHQTETISSVTKRSTIEEKIDPLSELFSRT